MAALLRIWLALAVAALIGGAASAAIPQRPAGPILDQADILPPQDEVALDAKLRAYTARTGRALMLVTVSSLDGEDINTYGVQLGQTWGVGGKTTDQGLILLIAPNERKLRFEVGYGLEQYLPDVLAGRIIRDTITPRFKANDYVGGINAGIDGTIAQLDRDPAETKAIAEAEAAAKAQDSRETSGGTIGGFIIWAFMIVVFMAVFGRGGSKGRRYGRGGGINPGIILWGASEIARGIANSNDRGSGGFGGFGGGGDSWGGFGGGGFGGGGASGGW